MLTRLNPYIAFDGNAREALEFYKEVFNAKIDMTTYVQGGMGDDPAGADKIMHGVVEAENGIVFMVADAPGGSKVGTVSNIDVSLSGDNEAELRGYWDKLAEGGMIRESLAKAPWGDTFGMLTDKFGIRWMVNISGSQA